ncbi:hypothetical protein [Desulfonatronovibrio magnus]|uniref:hypothetical protein n=1 Tax=Desulfonatronovibrio magnus TaxID=698827 RepID=UPI0012FC35D4|nr:hypothetical protein [Desulfonatronovibrio magnus]
MAWIVLLLRYARPLRSNLNRRKNYENALRGCRHGDHALHDNVDYAGCFGALAIRIIGLINTFTLTSPQGD